MPRRVIITESQLGVVNIYQAIIDYVKGFGVKGVLPSFGGKLSDYYKPVLKQAYEWASQSTDEVSRYGQAWFNREFANEVAGRFKFNKRGLIYVERSIDIDTSKGFDGMNFKSIGECWSWKPSNAQSYCADFSMLNNSVVSVVICGYVHPESVDWLETVYLNMYNMKNETEIRMNDNAKVEVSYIKVLGNKYSIGGTYLIDASSDKYNKNRANW